MKEIRINNKGDIVAIKVSNNSNYKNSYYDQYESRIICYNAVGRAAKNGSNCGIISLKNPGVSEKYEDVGFVKVTILDT